MTYTLIVGAVPVAGGESFYREMLGGAGHVVAADAGAEWCVGLGRVPDIAVGDFDSAADGAVERLRAAGVEVVVHPRDKDRTDLALAVELARDRWAAPLVLSAAFTERVDHTLAALGALTRAGTGARVAEPDWSAYACTPAAPLEVDLEAGDTLSVIAVGPASGVTVEGVSWPLVSAHLETLSDLGVSNLAIGGRVRVSVTAGTLIVITPQVDT
jgi:thiamine pyrophosphokinase